MSPDWRFALSNGEFWERLMSPRTLGVVLWIGLAVLTCALVVLMRTRWGHTKPLSKCIVLSVFAHILFLGYASGTKLVFDYPTPPQDEVLRLSLLEPVSDSPADVETDAQVWHEPFSSQLAEATLPSPDRRPYDEPLLLESPATEAPDLSRETPQPWAVTAPPDRETAPVPRPTRQTLPAPPPAELVVERAAEAAPAETVVETSPEAPSLNRLANESPPDAMAGEGALPEPSDVLGGIGGLQRLSDISLQTSIADAMAGVHDHLEADNRAGGRDGPQQPIAIGAQGSLAELLAAVPTVRRLGDSRPQPDLFKLRNAPDRMAFARQLGGNAQTEEAVQHALAWLASVQEPDGRWDAAKHGGAGEEKVLGHDRQHAGIGADSGITGLAILAFLGAGHSHYEGAYRTQVQHGLEYLVTIQKQDGGLSGNARLFAKMYCHGIAALAISEAYAMTGDDRLHAAVEGAVNYTVAAQHAGTGGWRYQPGDPGDTSQLGWQLLALRSAQLAGIEMPAQTRKGAERFLESVTSGPERGLASYRAGEAPSRTMTAEALLCRLFLEQRDQSAVREAVDFVMSETPRADRVNMYYWYYATMALFQVQGPAWEQWNNALQDQLLRLQRNDAPVSGSWDADNVWGGYGGRVYSTALAAMCLEVYYRYLPILGKPE